MTSSNSPTLSSLVGTVEIAVQEIRDPLLELSQTLSEFAAMGSVTAAQAQTTESVTHKLERTCLDILGSHTGFIEGIGVVQETLAQDPSMLWWRADQGVVARKRHVFNPDSDSYYDFSSLDWYQQARPDSLTIVGPYFDAWGTDDHTLTASLTVMNDKERVGVSACDLNVHYVTERFSRILNAHPGILLVDAEERVIASNNAELSSGLRIEPFLKRHGMSVVETAEVSVFGWSLIRLA